MRHGMAMELGCYHRFEWTVPFWIGSFVTLRAIQKEKAVGVAYLAEGWRLRDFSIFPDHNLMGPVWAAGERLRASYPTRLRVE